MQTDTLTITVTIDADDELATRIYRAIKRSFPFAFTDVETQARNVPPGGIVEARRADGSTDYAAEQYAREIVDIECESYHNI
jgi:hypothetical protein